MGKNMKKIIETTVAKYFLHIKIKKMKNNAKVSG